MGHSQLEVLWPCGYLNLSLRTEVWDKGHHPWEGGIIRNEDTGQRAKEYYQLRTKPTGKGMKGRM